jgi:hypothetical protein
MTAKERIPLAPTGRWMATGLVVFGHWRWVAVVVALAGLFLIRGLFTSGAYIRLFTRVIFGDFAGLWIQTIADVVATVASIVAILENYLIGPA